MIPLDSLQQVCSSQSHKIYTNALGQYKTSNHGRGMGSQIKFTQDPQNTENDNNKIQEDMKQNDVG
jgi:hypothetical protein